MKIDLNPISVRDLVDSYHEDNASGQVRGYSDRLDIRPPFQREFVYDKKQAAAVIETVMADFPLNVMYWGVRDDGTYEVIDGQQRTISLAHYVKGKFSVDGRGFANLQDDERERILGYKLHVYFCEGKASEKTGVVQDDQHRGRTADPAGTAQRGVRRAVGLGRQAALQQAGRPGLRSWQGLREREAHPPRLSRNGDPLAQG